MEKINLVEILKDCPKGTKLYSPIFGEVEFIKISDTNEAYPIAVMTDEKVSVCFGYTGKFYNGYHNAECLLFPSKDQRDWSKWKCPKPKFDPKTLQPFDRVLVQYSYKGNWRCEIFSHITETNYFVCSSGTFKCIIPYNDETKNLVGTTDEAPEYYRYWEE